MGRDTKALPRWLDGVAVAVASALMMAWTWRTWPDPLVDFGRELYLPWQITMGHVLYRDLAYFNGPLSPYLNAAWMWLLGVSLSAIIAANLVIMAVVLLLLYKLLDVTAGRLTAFLGALVFVTISGFGRLVEIGNYNFLCPYSHEITHGIALSLGTLACVHLPRVLGRPNVACAGFLFGLVLLTKVEIAAACGLAVAVGFGLRAGACPPLERLRLAALLVATALLPSVLAFALLWTRMPAPTALKGTLGSLYWALSSHVSESPFYRSGLGVDTLGANLTQMLIGAALISGAALAAVAAGFLAARLSRSEHSEPAAVITFVATVGLGLLTVRSPHWFESVPKALPFAMIFLLIAWCRACRRELHSPENSRVLTLRLALLAFALGLLAKMFFNTRLYHYGFALAIPAVLLLLATFVSWGPLLAESRGADFGVVRAVGIALAALLVLVYTTAMIPILRNQRYDVGSGPDAFVADERGAAVQATLQWIDRTMPSGATLAVLPEGAMINYLSRRSNSTPDVNFMPPELIMFGEDWVLHNLEDRPPDFVLFCHKDTTEYGVPLFGHDYGQPLAAWIHENYYEIMQMGDRPLERPEQFGMLLLRRRLPASEGTR